MSNRICSVSVTIDGVTYFYEAHSMHRVAEILSSQLRVLDTETTDAFKRPIYTHPIDSFEIHYFQESN